MKKKIFTISNLVLSTLITALGFGACKSAKNTEKEQSSTGTTVNTKVDEDDSSIPTTDSITPSQRRPDKEVRVLYGPPPTVRIKK